jgi:hypothetical protein
MCTGHYGYLISITRLDNPVFALKQELRENCIIGKRAGKEHETTLVCYSPISPCF